jgi:cell wall-associated NlpC family hydrolase
LFWHLPGEAIIRSNPGKASRLLSYTLLLVAVLALFGVSLVLTASRVSAEPAAISEAKQEVEALRAQIAKTNDELEVAAEDYQYAQVQLAETEDALKETQALLSTTEKDLKTAGAQLNERLDSIYRNGRIGLLETLFGARSFSDLINRFDLLTRVGEQDSLVFDQVSTYRDKMASQKQKLSSDRQKQAALLAEAKDAKARVEQKLVEREQLLSGKEQEVAQLEKEEEERQAKLAAQAAEAARQAAARAAASRQASSGNSNTGNKPSNTGTTTPAYVPSSRVGSEAVKIAMQYLGVPYVWAGADPSGFDCSGLVMYVYAQLGVNIPHSSRAQYGYGEAVSRSALEPGDLVFFGDPIHHVGMYVGDGQMIHAPYTGVNVRYGSIDTSDYTGARRFL